MENQKSIAGLITMFLMEGSDLLDVAVKTSQGPENSVKFLGDYVAHRLQPFLTGLQAYPVCRAEDHVTIDQIAEIDRRKARVSLEV